MIIPNFFIVGTPKAGTTSLYHYLEEHPEIFMSSIKETNYFSFEDIKAQGLFYNEESISTIEQYQELFSNTKGAKAIGEASVSYLFYPTVPQKIKNFNPNAKIIIILRDPIDRGYSHYLMDNRLGWVTFPYKDIVHQKGNQPKLNLYYQQYVGLGLYYEQVKRYLDVFGRNAVKIFLYEDLMADINGLVKEVYGFLGVDIDFRAATGTNHNAFAQPRNRAIEKLYQMRPVRKLARQLTGRKAEKIKGLLIIKGKKPQLDSQLKEELSQIYRDDILKTQELIGRDLSHWL